MLRINTIYFLFATLLLVSCNQAPGEREVPDAATLRETLAETNKILLSAEDQEIRDFIERYGWDEMQETGSGLRYWIYEPGDGKPARSGHLAVIRYDIHLLTGDLVYSSRNDGPLEFRIGRGGVESGLEEGILLMREGDRAKFIMPAHLAHGVPGDGVKIPQRAAIVYDVEILELK